VAALVWLKDNIGGFGGDSNRITLSGHGTGAALVNLLMISPLAAGKLDNQFFLFWLR
jgi:neuroligin